MPLLLIVDDDMRIVELLTLALARYRIVFATNGVGALHQVDAEHPDLVLLDLMLPDIDGGMLVRMIRERSAVPIIVLSGRQGQVDRVLALQAGADDFIAKPFDLYDLEARIEAVLRRSTPPVEPAPETSWRVGEFSLSDTRGPQLNGVPFHLTPVEFRLVRELVQHAGSAVPRAALFTAGWGSSDGLSPNIIDVNMGNVRRRMAQKPNAPAIVRIRGEGWLISADATLTAV